MSDSKKNRLVKFLFPIVFVIWGYVGYIIYDAFSPNHQTAIKEGIDGVAYKPTIQKRSTFTLLPIEGDPFFGIPYQTEKASSQLKKNTNEKPSIPWPSVQYQGIVSGGKSAIYMVSINGKQHLLSKSNNEIEGIRLVNGSEAQITLRFEGTTKKFPLM